MTNFINTLKSSLSINMVLIGLGIIIVILILVLVIRSLRTKNAKSKLDDMEQKFNVLKGYPLSFKMNKAIALAKVNRVLADVVSQYQQEYEATQEQLKEFSVLLAEIDDLLFSKKVKKALAKIEESDAFVKECEEKVEHLNELLDEVLEQENTQRISINALKNQFREQKRRFSQNRNAYRQAAETMDTLFKQIENMFSIFEEWMFASEFDKASDKQQEIKQAMANMNLYLDEIPSLYERATIEIPNALDDLKHAFTEYEAKGGYIEHMQFQENSEIIQELLSDCLLKLSKCDFERLKETLEDAKQRCNLLKEQLDKEVTAFTTISEEYEGLTKDIRDLNVRTQDIHEVYAKINERFGFENLAYSLREIDQQLDSLNNRLLQFNVVLKENDTAYTTLFLSFSEIKASYVQIEAMSKDLQRKLDNATSDEQRAKQQLIKLQLIVNEMHIKLAKNRLPSIDEKYEDDIRSANIYIADIKQILDVTPLNVEQLNAKLQEAIDYIYTLYNKVNSLVGMAQMVESAILFGNKYRSDYSEVDSELTRSELCYSNGQYTKALKIAINAIEKLHPGIYEKLLETEGESHA